MRDQGIIINVTINGTPRELKIQRKWTLLYLLREELGLTGTKYGCGTNDCGACKVLLDGKAVNSCCLPAVKTDGKSVITIEGLLENGTLNTIQQSFVEAHAIQCGFCTPGMIISTTALLNTTQNPSDEDISQALDNNLCRCTGYVNIKKAVKLAAERMRGK